LEGALQSGSPATAREELSVRSCRPTPPPQRPFRLPPPTPGRSIDTAQPVDHVLEMMRKYGAPIDRESYIHFAYGSTVPELESMLPEFLQDWSQFEGRK